MRARAEAPPAKRLLVDPEVVRYWRLQRGHTQHSLSKQKVELDGQLVQISYAQIRRIEKDGRCGPVSVRILAAVLAVEVGQLVARERRHLPCGLPREVSTDFVGREAELARVLDTLKAERHVRIAASVEGLPGIGKTELALQVCGLCEKQRRFRVFWFDAENPDLTAAWGDAVAAQLGIDAEHSAERAQLAVRAVEALAEPVLIVLDNVGEWSSTRPWPRPRGRHIRWLITTRVSGLGDRQFSHVEVPALDRSAARELMLRIAGEALAVQPGFAALLDHLDGYTIAVELAAAYLRRFPDVEPRDYLAWLAQGRGPGLEAEVQRQTLYGQTLERSLELLWQQLSPRVRQGWLRAACFEQALASAELSELCGLDRRLRAQLRDAHLIAAEGLGWTMHRLLRAFARRRASPEELEAARRDFLRGCVSSVRDVDGALAVYLRDHPHLDAALELAAPLLGERSEALAELRHGIAEARAAMGVQPRPRALLEQAVHFYRGALAAPAVDPLRGAGLQHRLARALYRQSYFDHGPAALREAVLACHAALQGTDRERSAGDWAAVQYTLGTALEALGRFDFTARDLERSIEAQRAALHVYNPVDHSREWVRSQSSLARALGWLGRKQGSELLEEAVRTYAAALAELTPQSSPLEWASLQTGLARVCCFLGEWTWEPHHCEQALRACQLALEVRTRERMPSQWAQTQHNLGCALRLLGEMGSGTAELEAALRAFELALEERTRAQRPLLWVDSSLNLGVALRALGERVAGAQVLERAVRRIGQVLEEVTPDRSARWWVTVQCHLGLALCALGERGADTEPLERAVAVCRSALAACTPELLPMDWALAQFHLGKALAALARRSARATLRSEAVHALRRAQTVFDAKRATGRWRQIEDEIARTSGAAARAGEAR